MYQPSRAYMRKAAVWACLDPLLLFFFFGAFCHYSLPFLRPREFPVLQPLCQGHGVAHSHCGTYMSKKQKLKIKPFDYVYRWDMCDTNIFEPCSRSCAKFANNILLTLCVNCAADFLEICSNRSIWAFTLSNPSFSCASKLPTRSCSCLSSVALIVLS